jgi:hypothetical protein
VSPKNPLTNGRSIKPNEWQTLNSTVLRGGEGLTSVGFSGDVRKG